MLDKAIEIIRETLRLGDVELTEDTNLKDDLGADSLDAVEIIMDIEDEFNIVFDYDDLSNFKTIKDLFYYINEEFSILLKKNKIFFLFLTKTIDKIYFMCYYI